MKRIRENTGEIYVPHKFKDGKYRVADPRLGKDKKLSKNQIPVPIIEKLKDYWRRGFHVRMQGETTKQSNLISPEEIKLSL